MGQIDRILEKVFTRRAASQAKKDGPKTEPKAGQRYLPKPHPPMLSHHVEEPPQEACNQEEDQAQEAHPDKVNNEGWEQEAYPEEAGEVEAYPVAGGGEEWEQEEDYSGEGGEENAMPTPAPKLTPTKGQQYGPHAIYVPLNAGWKRKRKRRGAERSPNTTNSPSGDSKPNPSDLQAQPSSPSNQKTGVDGSTDLSSAAPTNASVDPSDL